MKFSTLLLLTIIAVLIVVAAVPAQPGSDTARIIIGLDADMSSGSAKSGEAIRRGIVLALDEINRSGGIMGKKLELVVRDHRGNPARGIDNIREFSEMKNVLAVVGGLHTPVAMAELKAIHETEMIYLCPWAAGTPVVENRFNPSYVFRVSVRDQYAGGFLIRKALEKGFRRPALMLEQTGWGRSNNKAMTEALKQHDMEPAKVLWFNWGTDSFTDQISSAKAAGADVIMLVANAPEGSALIRSMASFPENSRLPIYSHWGITGGNFFETTREHLPKTDLVFLQTYSFIKPVFPERSEKLFTSYQKKFADVQTPADISAPAGTAHAYDLIRLLGIAAQNARSIDRKIVRDFLEKIASYEGLIKNYTPPFTPELHDALTADDFITARYDEKGHIIPVDKQ